MTLNNLAISAECQNVDINVGAQFGIINSTLGQTAGSCISMFINTAESNPCGPTNFTGVCWTSGAFPQPIYTAAIGNTITGLSSTSGGSGVETFRISFMQYGVITNNSIQGANGVGAVLKIHQGNSWDSCRTDQPSCTPAGNCCPTGVPTCITPVYPSCWIGIYTQYAMITDNAFRSPSGANQTEVAPQSAGGDERIRNVVLERNIYSNFSGAQGGRFLLLAAVNSTFRDNVMNMSGTSSVYPIFGVQVAQRGVEPVASADEIYNNTCYTAASIGNPQYCVGFSSTGGANAPGINSFAKNNLDYNSSNSGSTVLNSGTGNTVSNNTATITSNPGFTNGGGSFALLTDFKPTANYSGGVSVPVIYDALGTLWSPTWALGAIHP